MMKQVEVTIMGQGYILGCPEGGESLLASAVSSVDHEMSAIRDGGKVKARERIAVLAALNLAFALAERPDAEAARSERAADDAGTDADGETSTVDVAQLIKRLDMALGADGQLL